MKMKNETEKVNAFMDKLEHPLKAEMEAVRAIITSANKKICEHIKWGAPAFFYKENMATLKPQLKKYILVIFHNGAIIEDESGLLEGDSIDRRLAYFYNMEDVESKKASLKLVVNKWVKVMDK